MGTLIYYANLVILKNMKVKSRNANTVINFTLLQKAVLVCQSRLFLRMLIVKI